MSAMAATGSENCLAIGTRLSDFEITSVLGEGGFGIVYMAFDHALQRSVAIKEYMPGVLATRGDDHSITVRAERHQETFNVGLKSFINEARFLAQFDHPSLVKVHRFWEQNQTAYTAMQYYDGRTIKDIVNNSPELINEAWCRKIMKQILEALEMLYTMRILHRDVSPDNIIVQDSGDAVLLDFGSARQIIGDRTRGLTVILKPGYAPVEQYAGDASLDQGPYTDIYALAAVMYFAIMKEAPATSIARMVKDPITPLAERGVPGYSREFLSAIDKGLAVLAQDRPQTIDAFRALLGIEPPESVRARPPVPGQRFATLDRLPEALAPAAAPLLDKQQADATVPAAPAAVVASAPNSPPAPATPLNEISGHGASVHDGDADATVLAPPRKQPPAADPLAGAAAKPAKPLDKGADKSSDKTVNQAASRKESRPDAKAGAAAKPKDGGGKRTSTALIAGGVVLLAAAAGFGIYSMVSPSDTIMVAPPQAPLADAAPAPAPSAAAVPAVAAAPAAAASASASAAADNAPLAVLTNTPEPVADPAAMIAEKLGETPPEAPVDAIYRLSVKPWGTVFVDGKESGVTPPMKKLTLAPGKHKIRIVNPSFPDLNLSIDPSKTKSRTIEHDFAAQPK